MLSIELSTETWIAIVTLLVACISLIVAVLTLLSQKQTEKNTAPDINPQIQFSLLLEFIRRFILSVNRLYSLKYALIKTKYTTKPSHHFWSYFFNPNEYLFERVFYSDIKKFVTFKRFINQNLRFYEGINRLRVLFDEDASADEVKQEFQVLNQNATRIINNFFMLLGQTFNHQYHKSEVEDLIEMILPITRFLNIDDGFKNWACGKINGKPKEEFEKQIMSLSADDRFPIENEIYRALKNEVNDFSGQIQELIIQAYNIEKNDKERIKILKDFTLKQVISLIQLDVSRISYGGKSFNENTIDNFIVNKNRVLYYLKDKKQDN